MASKEGSAKATAGKAVMSIPAPPPYALATLSSSLCRKASVDGLASTILPPDAAFLDPYSWILLTNNSWIGSVALDMEGVAMTPKLRWAITLVILRTLVDNMMLLFLLKCLDKQYSL